jgi:hypothetical protein
MMPGCDAKIKVKIQSNLGISSGRPRNFRTERGGGQYKAGGLGAVLKPPEASDATIYRNTIHHDI